MNIWPKDNDKELDAVYSRPDGSAGWEVKNLTYVYTPWKSYLAGTDIELKRGIRVHKKVADDLTAIFEEIWACYGKTQENIEKHDLHQIGGAYYFRARRGSSRLSNHARGIAIDIDPLDNAMKKGNRGDIPQAVINIFENHGWRWGGTYGDPMHFEAVWNGGKPPKAPVTPPAAKPAVAGLKHDTAAWVDAAIPPAKRWEGFRATRYWDVKQWAIGYGEKADDLPENTVWTEEYASERLKAYLTTLAGKVAPLVKVQVNKNEGAALLLFAYNLGVGNLNASTLLKKLNEGNRVGASGQFERWVNANGKKLPGLVKRRAAEKELFLTQT